ncbi:TPA: SDR family NAD(P)-dependent oxidoreductase [Legionella pneumophila]
MELSLKEKNAIVTGGSKGLGADIAVSLAKSGAHVTILGRDIKGLEKTKSLVDDIGGSCHYIQVDLKEPGLIEEAAKKLLELNNSWDILINNAGIVKAAPLLELAAKDWDDIYQVNLRAAFLLSKYIVPGMIAKRYGKIINVSSLGTFFGTPGLGAYAASKAGLNQLTKTMAVEWGPYNIQINAICPTVVLTDMGKEVWNDPSRKEMRKKIEARIPLHRFAEPQEVSDLVVFLASSGSNFLNGCIIPIDDGARHNPS